MLKSLRNSVKSPFMKLFLLLLVLGFGLWGIGDISTGLITKKNEAISSNYNTISTNEVLMEFEKTKNLVAPNISREEAIQYGLLNDVIGRLAREMLYNAEANRLGLGITEKILKDKIKDENAFRDENNNFSKQKFIQILSQSGFTEEQYLEKLGSQLKQEQIINSILENIKYPYNIAKIIASFQLEERKAKILEIKSDPKIIKTPSNKVLEDWFNNNIENYRIPILRNFDVLYLNPNKIKNELVFSEKEIKEGFEIWKDEFSSQEKRLLKQMVFDTEEAAKLAVDDFKEGKDFPSIAKNRLDWSVEDINLGYLTRDELDENMSSIVFSKNLNELIGPIKTEFGYNLAIVKDIKLPVKANLKNSKNLIIEKLKNEKSIDLLYKYIEELENELGSGSDLKSIAQKINQNITTIENIDENGEFYPKTDDNKNLDEIITDTTFLDEAWKLKINEISTVIESANDSFFVIELKSETASKLPKFIDHRNKIIEKWKIEKGIEEAKLNAKNILENNNFKSNIKAITSEKFRRNGSGLDNENSILIANSIFKQKINEIKIIETKNSALILENISIIQAEREEIKKLSQQIQKNLNQAISNDLLSALSLHLSELFELDLKPQNVSNTLLSN